MCAMYNCFLFVPEINEAKLSTVEYKTMKWVGGGDLCAGCSNLAEIEMCR